jgi:hypothetical protein
MNKAFPGKNHMGCLTLKHQGKIEGQAKTFDNPAGHAEPVYHKPSQEGLFSA